MALRGTNGEMQRCPLLLLALCKLKGKEPWEKGVVWVCKGRGGRNVKVAATQLIPGPKLDPTLQAIKWFHVCFKKKRKKKNGGGREILM